MAMESLFNSPFMVKLQDFGQALGRNKFLSALQAAMMSLMGVIMVGAIFQIICSVGSSILGLFTADSQIYAILYSPYNYTMNMLGLWTTGLLAFNYARNLEIKSPIISTVEALVVFMLMVAPLSTLESGSTAMDITYLGATGMFVGFATAFVTVNIDRICVVKKIYIRMPDIVPQFLQDGFAGIVPMLFNVIIGLALSSIVNIATGGAYTVGSGFMALLAAPLGALTSLPGMFIICIFGGILWCFGIHGTMIIYPILMPMMLQANMANAEAYAAGGASALVFYPVLLFGAVASCGGTGNTFPVALYGCFFAKSEQVRAVGKAGIVPGWFNINEPITFGMPIMYNPILCIPYVLSIPVNMLFYWFGYATGLIIPAWINSSALLPMGFAAFLTTLNPMNAVWDYLSIIPMALVWLPFVKAYDNQLYAKEQAAAGEQTATAEA